MVSLKGYRLKAASLPEVIVAMVLLVIVYGVGTMIYLNVSRSAFSAQQWHASLQLNDVVTQTLSDESYFDQVLDSDSVTINKKVSPYHGSSQVLLLELDVYTKDQQKIASRRQLIRVHDHH